MGVKHNPVPDVVAGSVTTITNRIKEKELTIVKETDVEAGDDEFTFNLKLWMGSSESANPYILPDDYPLILTGVLTRVADGEYTFTMKPGNGGNVSQVLELPAGIHYRVTESHHLDQWHLIASHDTAGVLNVDKDAYFLNAKAQYLKVIKET